MAYAHATAKVQSMMHDPGKGGTEVTTEVYVIGDAGEPPVVANASAVLRGAVTQQQLYDAIDASVAEALTANGVTLGAGRTIVICGRVL